MKIREESVAKGLAAAKAHVSCKLGVLGRDNLDRVGVVGSVGLVLNLAPPEELADDAVHPYLMTLEHARVSETQGPGSLRACVVYAERALRGAVVR